MKSDGTLGLYFHIPFCVRKCPYCGFWSEGGALTPEKEAAYTTRLCRELAGETARHGREAGAEERIVDTVFFGGGTPTLFQPENIGRILGEARKAFRFAEDCEITLEGNPGTVTPERLSGYRSAGVNRLSLGVQALDDAVLRRLGRIHTAREAEEAVRMARSAGFENLNLDLMFAAPGHTMKEWEETLARAVDLAPEHLSFYSLQLEEGTPFFEQFERGELTEVPEDLDREMYHRAIRVLGEAGYRHYEISNAARPGRECRHNLKYWDLREYLGLGDSAASYLDGQRWTEDLNGDGNEVYNNTPFDDMSEYVFTGLRKREGIRFDAFRERFGEDLWEVFGDRREELAPFFESGALLEDEAGIRLSENGIDISNKIMAVFV